MTTRTGADVSPWQPLNSLDQLWFQVAGTRCNLTCQHCFISCSPHNDRFGFLSLDDVRHRLQESLALGVKEFYFTGGEPFLNPDMTAILVETLQCGPATVLTNGTVLKDAWLETLAAAEQASIYSLEFRVSIDGCSADMNDPIRGEGTFRRAMQGVAKLVQFGFLPIITAARTWPDEQEPAVIAEFTRVLREQAGYDEPRLKLLPTLRIGAEAERSCGYRETERVTTRMMEHFDDGQLLCEHGRIVTDRGVHVCPILIEEPSSRLGATLHESQRSFQLSHGACYTCYLYGAICSNQAPASALSRRPSLDETAID
ncbi:MAG: radical SAM protein [Planctomycetales bacterium]|nr:radical SAM protein [Planctomycetales bacterium]